MMVMPLALPTALAAPLGLTVPLTPWPTMLPLLTTTAEVLLPEQVVPTALRLPRVEIAALQKSDSTARPHSSPTACWN